jgi:cytochrome oxidase Cu insertion factor (SCO1/SenC/PrrC family)
MLLSGCKQRVSTFSGPVAVVRRATDGASGRRDAGTIVPSAPAAGSATLPTPPSGATGQGEGETDDFGHVPEFTLTDQDGHSYSRSNLDGKVWIASFLFTRCATLCPQIAARMAELQKVYASNPDIHLVSITVDPENDTPQVLKAYAAAHNADTARWSFLTGPEKNIYDLVGRRGFMLGVAKNEGPARTPGNEVTHSSRLAVVDRKGAIRGYFDGRAVDDEGHEINEVPALKRLVDKLLKEKP